MGTHLAHADAIEQIKKVDGVLKSVTSEDGSLFSGVYKTKIYPEDLPEWYKKDRYYKRQGYMSTQGIVDMVYIPSQLGTFLKDDVLLVSYVNRIEKIQSETAWPIYKSYRGYYEKAKRHIFDSGFQRNEKREARPCFHYL